MNNSEYLTISQKLGGHTRGSELFTTNNKNRQYEGCSKSFANRYTENTQSIGI